MALRLFALGALFLFFQGCATRTPQTKALIKNKEGRPQKALVQNVPFAAQTENFCGPATLSMASAHAGRPVSMKEVSKLVYTPGAKGSFKSEMLSGAARLGHFAVPIKGLQALVEEINRQRPVIAFRNLGFDWYPLWHYSLIYGYDLNKEQVRMHSGKDKAKDLDLDKFERSWRRADYWGMVLMRPGELSENASEWDSVRAAAYLEAYGREASAELAYDAILRKWPKSALAAVGKGNLLVGRGNYSKAESFYRKALSSDPKLTGAWTNLALVLEKQGKASQAKQAKEMAGEQSGS